MSYSYKPENRWTSRHQMSFNGKIDDFNLTDMIALGQVAGLKNIQEVVAQVKAALSDWMSFAEKAELSKGKTQKICCTFRTVLDS